MSSTALLLVDLQNDFIHPDGAYARAGVQADAIAALPGRVAPVVDAARPGLLTQLLFQRGAGPGGVAVQVAIAALERVAREDVAQQRTRVGSALERVIDRLGRLPGSPHRLQRDELHLGAHTDGGEQPAGDRVVPGAGQLLGIAEATLTMATDYAGKREQFGKAIGAFQAVKHMCSDMFVRQEVARAAAYAAGATIDHPDSGDVVEAVGAAKVNCGESAMKNARACIQVHGGMGYTWEVPAHYYLKRTWVLNSIFGTPDDHADEVSERVGVAAA